MPLEDMKIAAVIAWAIIWSVIAVFLVSAPGSWILVVGSGVLPPLVIVWMCHRRPRPVPAIIRDPRT